MMEEEAPSAGPTADSSRTVLWLLYLESFLSSFGERGWQFAVPLLLSTMYPSNMWPAASLAFVEQLTGFIAGPMMGALIDRSEQYSLVWWAVVMQTLSLFIASCCFYALVWQGLMSVDAVPVGNWRFWMAMIGLYITAAVNSLCAMLDSVSLSKIWVPAICREDERKLSMTNAALRRINLFCGVASPLAVGALLSFLSAETALSTVIVAVTAWNVVSLPPELWTLKAICNRVPSLKEMPPVQQAGEVGLRNPFSQALSGWRKYRHHNVFLVSLGYCCLYFTVLMPGALFTSYLVFYRIEQYQIAIFQSLCAVTGMGATLVAPWLMQRVGVVRAG
jgi:iron-regulated transporter 1